MRTPITRLGLPAAGAALVLLLASCSSDTSSPATSDAAPAAEQPAAEEPAPADESTAQPGEGDGDYAFGTDRDQIASAIESAFSSQNGATRWEGDTLVLTLPEGDADETMAGFSECLVLSQLLTEDDSSTIEFPNGSIDCAEALGS